MSAALTTNARIGLLPEIADIERARDPLSDNTPAFTCPMNVSLQAQ